MSNMNEQLRDKLRYLDIQVIGILQVPGQKNDGDDGKPFFKEIIHRYFPEFYLKIVFDLEMHWKYWTGSNCIEILGTCPRVYET